MEIPKTECVKINELRKIYGPDINLEKWMNTPNNLYVGRKGRIFITDKTIHEKRIFHYQGSKWANPFKLDSYTLEESLNLYNKYIIDSGLINSIHELSGKTLGCFCTQSLTIQPTCHAQILVMLYKKIYLDL
jgi:hypothetical protein